jgi:hypothetical protein
MLHQLLKKFKLNSNKLRHNQRPLLNQQLLSPFNSKLTISLHSSKPPPLSQFKLLQALKENQWISLKKTSSQPIMMTTRNCQITT